MVSNIIPRSIRLQELIIPQQQLRGEVMWNSILWRLENCMSAAVENMTTTAPPTTPSPITVYKIAETGAVGAWAGRPGQIAYFEASEDVSQWRYVIPWKGFRWIDKSDTTKMYVQTVAPTENLFVPSLATAGSKKSWAIA